ncbi:acetolactate decarboxylase [Flavobacteriaceae bacterium]|uniref:acetolactate decarboxylase n=1 Tax=Candidatus Arcticimaribacter forsetii TaxID=2820661 RepID=UPI0020777762|nr:acetolactate decarboxylase [Candidatus Arcticimaribacter forsetii]MDA8699370.1 acetolactate decarboxylase [Flavobacteriaceae bacterium]MDB2325870.1 acetolactate decarboxylase [Flavobacteriaceae bacterium]MDB2346141.1 acetolactate decarboxylase [Flavobacteriaceae bacterium]MDB4716973.1 acetolactate decarboxylase [Flavobacteriaceae bacterium]
MNKLTYITVLVFFTIAFLSCRDKESKTLSTVVKHSGALRTIMSGNIQPVISLDTLSKMKNLYALGAVDNLKGEIQIFDSQPSNSFVVDSSLQIKDSYNLKASLLVYAEIKAWESFEIKNCATKSDLEEQIFKIATEYNIDTNKPFPFLLEGNVKSLDWHVINWKDGDTIHNHKKHKESGLNGTLQNKDVEIIGFYSTKHKAIFTHHTTNIHMHFKTEDDAIAGHIDDLLLNNSITLKLPK